MEEGKIKEERNGLVGLSSCRNSLVLGAAITLRLGHRNISLFQLVVTGSFSRRLAQVKGRFNQHVAWKPLLIEFLGESFFKAGCRPETGR